MDRFVALDSWRGVAACLVALLHLDAYSHIYGVPFLRNCWLFVDFFFVLSGFVIAANYQQRLLEGFGAGRFFVLRLGRLYPLHLAMLALFIAWELFRLWRRHLHPELSSVEPFGTPAEAPGTILANLLLVQSLHLYDFMTWNLAAWSISVEFYTYVIFAACIIGLRKHAWIAALLAITAGPVLIAALSERNMETAWDWGIIRCIYGFAAGVVSWKVYDRWGGVLQKWLSGSAAEWGAVALVIAFVSLAGISVASVAAPYVFALVVIVFAFERGAASAILRLRPLVFLGTISYSIYMTHVFVMKRLFDIGYHLDSRWGFITHHPLDGGNVDFLGTQLWQGDIAYPLYLLLVVAVSYLTYRWIEKPGREWTRKLVQGRGRTAARLRSRRTRAAEDFASGAAPGSGPPKEFSR
jgi:peptidoglycan/LPS O-acetylase OafA/YrhL